MTLLKKLSFLFPKKQAKAYEGATTGRRLGSWGLSSLGPNSTISDSLSQLRARSRDLTRNNPWVANGCRSLASNLIGCGITARWILQNDVELKVAIQTCWQQWTDEADLDGHCDFYGLQLLVAQTLIQSGEALVRIVPIKNPRKGSVPLRIQVLEPDFLAEDLDKHLDNGNIIKMGIEQNQQGIKVACHIYRTHPGELGHLPNQTIRIPKQDLLQVYRVDRPGQLRGVPWVSSVLLKLRELDQYEDAELVRKKTAAMFAGFITESAPDYNLNNEEKQDLRLESGMVKRLAPGENIEFSQPSDVGGNYEVWIKQQLRAVASGMGLSLFLLWGCK